MQPQDPVDLKPIASKPITTEPVSSGPIKSGPVKFHPFPGDPLLPQPTFTFTLDSFQITNTRSRHEDTDYVSFTLLVQPQGGGGTPQTLTKSMGDVNNGTYSVGLSFPNVKVGPTDTVVVNYLIVNSGHSSESSIYSTLDSAAGKLATAGASAATGALIGSAIPGLGTALGAIAGWLAGEITSILDANCDGPVAAEQNTFSYSDLLQQTDTANGTFSETAKHPGTDSNVGCGSNSMYYVSWHIQKVATPGIVVKEPVEVLTAK